MPQILRKLDTIRELLERDPVCARIVVYLNRHGRAVDTARGVAEWWINQELRSTQEALLLLLNHGVVRSYVQGTTRMYAYTKNPLLRQWLSRYVKSLNHRGVSLQR
jgi:hypothetical protein